MAFGNSEAENLTVKNYYSTLFNGSSEVADYVFSEYDYLYNMTSKYRDILFRSSLPAYVLDALASNTAGLKTNLIRQDHLGRVHGYEGLGNDFGCCPGNCTHVWNYAQSMAFLFPALEQKVREVSFLHDTHENGYQCFRTTFPPGDYWFKNVAADGQMGNIMRVYREWKLSGDSLWLAALWPKVKAALEFAWKGSGQPRRGYEWQNNASIPWDPGKEGVMRGDQHNTYDINFYGPNTMTGSLYLGALKACAEMAGYLGDMESSKEYLELYDNGRNYYETECWNGEYFIQLVEVAEGIEIRDRLVVKDAKSGTQEIKYQYGNGCLSDQLFGQYLAHVSGLGYLFDSAKVDAAMDAIYRYNYKPDLSYFQNVQRVYALNNEGGLLTCTWPLGVRPQFPFVYADEVWTGIEYQAAASMIWSGYVSEGLDVVKSVRDRYRGFNRNPFAEIESGRFYARSMSSWGVLLALSGFEYDGVVHSMKFDPKINHLNFSTFWSCGSGWGEFKLKDKEIILEVAFGELELNRLQIPAEYGSRRLKNNLSTAFEIQVDNDLINIIFNSPIVLMENEKLVLTAGD